MNNSNHHNRASKTKVFLVDDHPLMRQGIAQLINGQPDMEVCGEADDAPTGLKGIEQTKPDAAIVDISLKGTNGIELIKNLRALYKFLPILVLSMHDETVYAQRVLRAGALGYVMKQDAAEKVVAALRRILEGEIYVSEAVGSQMLHQALTGRGKPNASPVDRLSDRELEVIQSIGRGKATREIAKELNVSVKTIESHRAHIKDKLGLKNASELVKFSVQWVENEINPKA
jgi:DNA-binding NarL/FixJ family response regulator